jgi:hypothetical protein
MSTFLDGKRREALRIPILEQVYRSRPAQVVLDDKHDLYKYVADYIGRETHLTYLEFGVAAGQSISFLSGQFSNPQAVFYGFDSFQGLPEAWLNMPQFTFGRDGKAPPVADERVKFVQGWFQNTIPPFFNEWKKPAGPVLIHYDADLYSSTLFALAVSWPHVQNYYFMMDDFLTDDAIALSDFASSFPVQVEFIAQAGRDGLGRATPSWVFGKITTQHFEPAPAS